MPINPIFGQRARAARRQWEANHDPEKLTYAEIGRLVADEMGREEAFSHQAVRRWFVDGQEPDSFATTDALARVLGVSYEWLSVGRGEGPPVPAEPAQPRRSVAQPAPTTGRVQVDPAARAKRRQRPA